MKTGSGPMPPLVLLLALLATACGGGERPAGPLPTVPAPAVEPAPTNRVALHTDLGVVVIDLLPDEAPQTVAQFQQLARDGFYNQTRFHRVVIDRLIQGGDPLSRDNDPYNDGQGTAGRFLPLENPAAPMTAGAVAMAGDPGQASCQFFICVRDQPQWQGRYTVFGRVREGHETVEAISRLRVGQGVLAERPIRPPVVRRVEFLADAP